MIRHWHVPGLSHDDIERRSRKYMAQNNVHELTPELINDNNRLFVDGCRKLGWMARQFPLNLSGCRGSSLCNLGCPNAAKQGTHRVQLPNAEASGVEVVTRAEALEVGDRTRDGARVIDSAIGEKGLPSEWAPGHVSRSRTSMVVLAGGAIGTSALILRSPDRARDPARRMRSSRVIRRTSSWRSTTQAITNDVGHPKSYYLDRAEEERFRARDVHVLPVHHRRRT